MSLLIKIARILFIHKILYVLYKKLDHDHSVFLINTLKSFKKKSSYCKIYSESIILNKNSGLNIFITFDVDTVKCYELLKIDFVKEYYMPFNFNLLTNWVYKYSFNDIDNIFPKYEFGSHSSDHDIFLAYHNVDEITGKIKMSQDKLGFKPKGFRSPALSFSKRLVDVLDTLGFEYNSSIMSYNTRQRIPLFSPYKYEGLKLWEFPILIMDTKYWVDWKMSESEALDDTFNLLERFENSGEAVTFCFHPCYFETNFRYYDTLFNYIVNQKGMTPLYLSSYIDNKV